MICRGNVSKRAQGVNEIKGHYQSPNRLRQDQQFRRKGLPEAVKGSNARFLHAERLVSERKVYLDWETPEMDSKRAFSYKF